MTGGMSYRLLVYNYTNQKKISGFHIKLQYFELITHVHT